MGQYWKCVNLDRHEFIYPYKLGSGLKLWEILANEPGVGAALVILCAAMPEQRGGGDFDLDSNWHGPERTFPEHNLSPGPMSEEYHQVAKRTIGRWAGDRIALVGDYAERSDLPPEDNADLIYDMCISGGDDVPKGSTREDAIAWRKEIIEEERANNEQQDAFLEEIQRLDNMPEYVDITDDVARVIEHELQGEYQGEGWKHFVDYKRRFVEIRKMGAAGA